MPDNENTEVKKEKYLELISKSQDDQDKEELRLLNEESLQNVKSDILATEKEINQVKRELLKVKSARPLQPKSVIEQTQKLLGLQNGLKALKDLETELF